MSGAREVALQLCPFSEYLETGLKARFETVRWFDLGKAAQEAFLAWRAQDVRAVVSGGHLGCPNALIEMLPRLGIIGINGVGLDRVDLEFAARREVRVTNTPGVLTEDVADLAVGLIIGLLRGIPAGDAHVKSGAWLRGDRPLGRKVSGRHFGIVGLGRIGLAIGERLAVFGAVSYTGPRQKAAAPFHFEPDLHALSRTVDVLVLACPSNAATRHLVGASVLEALGPEGYLINVARGAVVEDAALLDALKAGRIAGAALDVFANEPQVPEELRSSDAVVLTPHIASATVETRMHMADIVLAALDDWRARQLMVPVSLTAK
jgi:lactate dehydrogenase-like 2-hydroxyacid dehydrogenase